MCGLPQRVSLAIEGYIGFPLTGSKRDFSPVKMLLLSSPRETIASGPNWEYTKEVSAFDTAIFSFVKGFASARKVTIRGTAVLR